MRLGQLKPPSAWLSVRERRLARVSTQKISEQQWDIYRVSSQKRACALDRKNLLLPGCQCVRDAWRAWAPRRRPAEEGRAACRARGPRGASGSPGSGHAPSSRWSRHAPRQQKVRFNIEKVQKKFEPIYKEFLTQELVAKLSRNMGLGSVIRDPGFGKNLSWIRIPNLDQQHRLPAPIKLSKS